MGATATVRPLGIHRLMTAADAQQAARAIHSVVKPWVTRFADQWTDRQAAVDRDREIRRRLTSAMVRRQVLRGGGDADEHRRLAGAGEQPGEHQHPQFGGDGVEQDRDPDHRGAGHRQHTPAPSVPDAPGPGAQQGRRHRQRADADAHLHAPAAEFVLYEPGHRGDERTQGDEVRERRQHHHRKLRREQAFFVVVLVEPGGRRRGTGSSSFPPRGPCGLRLVYRPGPASGPPGGAGSAPPSRAGPAKARRPVLTSGWTTPLPPNRSSSVLSTSTQRPGDGSPTR